jgi:hypothetical protein
LIPAVLLAALSGTAAASGFQLLEQGSGLGNAYAGSAAKANDASTIFWNPAGMTQLQAREVSGGLTAVRPSFKFDDKGSQVGDLNARVGDGGDAGGWGYIPNGYLSWALNKDLYRWSGHWRAFRVEDQVRQAVEGQCAVERVRHQDDQHQPLDRLSGERQGLAGCGRQLAEDRGRLLSAGGVLLPGNWCRRQVESHMSIR